ncbi:MAG TPA: hypothetical protein VJZ26_02280 [Blastocatellia bacterium]|nr:hypothetical protein [Blastocatellia bacterium]
MKSKVSLAVILFALLIIAPVRDVFPASPDDRSVAIAGRIERVENGLLPAVAIKGRPT